MISVCVKPWKCLTLFWIHTINVCQVSLALWAAYMKRTGIFVTATGIVFSTTIAITTSIFIKNYLFSAKHLSFTKENLVNFKVILVIFLGVLEMVSIFLLGGYFLFVNSHRKRASFHNLLLAKNAVDMLCYFQWAALLATNLVVYICQLQSFHKTIARFHQYLRSLVQEDCKQSLESSVFQIETKVLELCSTSSFIQDTFAVPALLNIICVFIVIFNASGFAVIHFHQLQAMDVVSVILQFISSVVLFVIVVEVSDAVQRQKSQVEATFCRFLLKACHLGNQRVLAILNGIIKNLEMREFHINACGFFHLSRQFLMTVSGILITYTVLVYQFADEK